MSTTVPKQGTSAAPPPARRRGQIIMLRLSQALLALSFAAAALQKLAGTHEMVDMFTKIGAGQWLRYLTGTLEIAGAAGLLIPQLSGLAALGLTGLMTGAAITNVFIIHTSPVIPLALLAVSALVAWGRWPTTRALPGRLRHPAGPAAIHDLPADHDMPPSQAPPAVRT